MKGKPCPLIGHKPCPLTAEGCVAFTGRRCRFFNTDIKQMVIEETIEKKLSVKKDRK